jgi:predicted Rossmann fold flavoprotein
VPSAVALIAKNQLSQEAPGIKLDMEVTSIIDNQKIKKTYDEVMITQYGFSGPAILNISREISIHLNRFNKDNALIELNFFPKKSREEVLNLLESRWLKKPSQSTEMSLNGLFAPKLPPVILKILNINPEKKVADLENIEKSRLVDFFTSFSIKVKDTRGWNEAEFTAGGVDTKDVKKSTLESTLIPKLYFAGEILDVDGDVGGFNLSWAWSSGFVAGKLG